MCTRTLLYGGDNNWGDIVNNAGNKRGDFGDWPMMA